MSHSSQLTKAEYANKHESNIASKMANMWERKIGSDKDHKPSPTTVVKQSSMKVENINPLPRAGSKKASSGLRRKNTREIVETFERMASRSDSNDLGFSGTDKIAKKSSMIHSGYGKGANGKEDISNMIERISAKMNDINDEIALLKSKINSL